MAIVNIGVYEACSVSVLEHCGVRVQRAIKASSLAGAALHPPLSGQCEPALLPGSLGLRLAYPPAAFHGDSVQGKHSTRLMVASKCFCKDVSYSGLSVRLDPIVNNAFPTCIMGAWIRIGENNSTMEQPLQGETI